jgi:hypothetical protein
MLSTLAVNELFNSLLLEVLRQEIHSYIWTQLQMLEM